MSKDPDDDRGFTEDEKRDYPLQVCPICERRTMRHGFIAIPGEDPTTMTYRRHGGSCANPQCATNGGPEGKDRV